MVAFSKSRRALFAVPILCLTFLTLSSLTRAQTFANVKYESMRHKANNMMDEDDNQKSHVDQLDGNSSIWDMIAAHQKDFF